jgi:hypothetical protein
MYAYDLQEYLAIEKLFRARQFNICASCLSLLCIHKRLNQSELTRLSVALLFRHSRHGGPPFRPDVKRGALQAQRGKVRSSFKIFRCNGYVKTLRRCVKRRLMYLKEDDLPSAVAINSHVYSMAGVQTLQLKSNWNDNLTNRLSPG